MPIQFSEQDTRLSTASLVNGAQNYLTVNRDNEGKRTDGFMKDTAKVVTRFPVNLTLAAIATIETVVRAAFTVLTSILYPITARPVSFFAESTKLAGRATVEALKGTLGYATPEVKKEEPAPAPTPEPVAPAPTRTQIAKEKAKAVVNFLWNNKGPAAQFIWNHKGKIALGAAAMYFLGRPALNGVSAGFSTFGSGVKENVEGTYNSLYNAGETAVSGVKTGVSYGAGAVASAATYSAGKIGSAATTVWNWVPNILPGNSTQTA
ncbi:MAG: hypothetical protein JSS30_02355 [Verrucomicrobia bacterium]|nr:hypothetical protein [Verrucomicrobiota bacterium]